MEAHDKSSNAISFETTKIRGGKEMKFTSPIDWETLRISPQSIDKPQEKETIKKAGKKKDLKQDDTAADLPWDA